MNLQADISKPVITARWLGNNELPLWDRFVDRHPKGVLYHTSKWMRALEKAFPHMEGKVLAMVDESSEIRAGLPVYLARSWLMGTRLLSIPYASCCDALFSPSDWNQLFPKIVELHEKISAKATEIRSLRHAESFSKIQSAVSFPYKHHYIPLGASEEKILMTFSRTAIRQMIQKAAKSGFVVKQDSTEKGLRDFNHLFCQSRKRLSLPPIPLAFFKAMLTGAGPENFSLFVGYSREVPMAALWVSKYKHFSTLEYIGEAAEARGSGISQMLYWQAIQESIREGRKECSLGRTALNNEGLLDYKRRWGTVEEDLGLIHYPFRSDEDQNGESYSYRLAKKMAAVLPEPFFQAMGRFCFKHWA